MSDGHLDLVLRVLDHQIVGPRRELVGKVDDLELSWTADAFVVTGLVVGPGGLSQRLPGRLGAWVGAVWRRLSTGSEPQPVVVPTTQVTDLGSAVELTEAAVVALQRSFGLERWLRRYVVGRIPGAKGGDHDEALDSGDGPATPTMSRADLTEPPVRPPAPGAQWLSALLGAPVLDEDGHRLGDLIELHTGIGNERWTLTHLQVTHSPLGTELGYHADPHQGPALLRRAFRHLQRHDVLVPVGEITEIRTEPARVVVTRSGARRHPHHDATAPRPG